MEIRNGIACYDGPPVWILSQECRNIVKQLPTSRGVTPCYMDMADGKRVSVYVVAGTMAELPAPYTTRDIRIIGRLL